MDLKVLPIRKNLIFALNSFLTLRILCHLERRGMRNSFIFISKKTLLFLCLTAHSLIHLYSLVFYHTQKYIRWSFWYCAWHLFSYMRGQQAMPCEITSILIKFYCNIVMHTHLCFYGCFHTTMVWFSSCDREHMKA